MKKMRPAELAEIFQGQFHAPAEIFSAPGRVNLIGEHTDYNEGYVLPSAIGFYAHVAISPRADQKLMIRSTQFPEAFEIDLSSWPPKKMGAWYDYVLGVGVELVCAGMSFPGANLLVHGEVPIGAGLSSSAALEVASALALLSLEAKHLPLKTIARLCQQAENHFVGARVGIMDQFVSCHGQADHAVLLDCRSLEYELVPIPASLKLVISNTMVKHQLSGGEYNLRREQCEQGVQILAKKYPQIKALRDVSTAQLETEAKDLPPLIYQRCLHVVRENRRVLDTAESFRSGDLPRVGQLMRESHASLRDLYEVSSPELDVMVESAEGLPGFIGGRMTGGGFGGCTVNLVETSQAQSFATAIAVRYRQKTGISPDIHICSAAHGAGAELRKAEV
ncbi:MAG: galactokinase [Acidobacteria bacterium]|nr:galactokinase [Acidobacteriota bacterium]